MLDQMPFVISQVGWVRLARVHTSEDTPFPLGKASFLDTLLVT
jgi:hypothetical protein